ncbi:MAG: response regulator [Lachnospiraceae bacterium]|nr:response regulator [Lachnospiraceae bacterium]
MYKILIADDEPIERQVITKKIHGFFPNQVEIFLAENGVEAVDAFKKHDCQIALLDISMPGKTGLEAAEEIRAYNEDCSIIFLTAFDEFNYAKKAISVRALDYLLKPGCDEEIVGAFEKSFSIADDTKHRQHWNHNVVSVPAETTPTEGLCSKKSQAIAKEIKAYIDAQYQRDLALQDVAGEFGYSEVYFCKLFKQQFGKSFIVYLNELRIEKAKELLANPNINIKDIGVMSGYREANYFARVFRRVTGMSPSEYRSGVTGS